MPSLPEVSEFLYTIQPIIWAIAKVLLLLCLVWILPKIQDAFKKPNPDETK